MQVTLGKHVVEGKAEVKSRRTGAVDLVPLEAVVAHAKALLAAWPKGRRLGRVRSLVAAGSTRRGPRGAGDLERGALSAVEDAARFTADRVAAGDASTTSTRATPRASPIARAGGLVGLHGVELDYALRHPVPPGREGTGLLQSYVYDVEALGDTVAAARTRAGDVLWLVSNSGKEALPVALAIGARARGCAVVAVTSVAFSDSLDPRHSSGKRLHEVADRVVDTRGPIGDAALPVEGLATSIGPLSGLLNVAAVWALTAALVDALLARGIAPAVYRSVNLPGGFAYNAAAEARYRERGI